MTANTRPPYPASGAYTLLAFKQIAYSRNGCPRWHLTMVDSHATPIAFVTASGAASAYGARPHDADVGKLYLVRHHRTKGGKLVADAWSKAAVSEVSDGREPARLT